MKREISVSEDVEALIAAKGIYKVLNELALHCSYEGRDWLLERKDKVKARDSERLAKGLAALATRYHHLDTI